MSTDRLRGDLRPRVLFLCTGNSCRSQMAEGWARHLKSGMLRVESAGLEARGLDPRAVRVMAEVGVDIAAQRSKTLATLADTEFDVVVTVCHHARESCPRFPGEARLMHVSFDDPPALARKTADDETALGYYRRVRDEIRSFVESLPESIAEGDAGR